MAMDNSTPTDAPEQVDDGDLDQAAGGAGGYTTSIRVNRDAESAARNATTGELAQPTVKLTLP